MPKQLLTSLLSRVALVSPVMALEQPRVPGHLRAVVVPHAAITPVVDGTLDEEFWQNAAIAGGFWISEEKRSPTEQTEVLVMSDGENLYFGFRCIAGCTHFAQRRPPDFVYDPRVNR